MAYEAIPIQIAKSKTIVWVSTAMELQLAVSREWNINPTTYGCLINSNRNWSLKNDLVFLSINAFS